MDNDKPVEPIEEDIEKTIETVNIEEEQQIAIIPETKVRTNELHACSKCCKLMTLKTLKYTHENTCNIKEPPPKPDKPTPKQKNRPKKEIVLNNFPKIQEEKETEEKKKFRYLNQKFVNHLKQLGMNVLESVFNREHNELVICSRMRFE